VSYSEWTSVLSGAVTTRYVRVRWTVTGANPILYAALLSVYLPG